MQESVDEVTDVKAKTGKNKFINAGALRLGSRFMWGFAPERRSDVKKAMKENKPRTEFEIILERERRKAERKAEKKRHRRELKRQRSTASTESGSSAGAGGGDDSSDSDEDGSDEEEYNSHGRRRKRGQPKRGDKGGRKRRGSNASISSGTVTTATGGGTGSGRVTAKRRGSLSSQPSLDGTSGTPFASGRRSEASGSASQENTPRQRRTSLSSPAASGYASIASMASEDGIDDDDNNNGDGAAADGSRGGNGVAMRSREGSVNSTGSRKSR